MSECRWPRVSLFAVLFAMLASTSFRAQQNGTTHPVSFVEPTYGESINAIASDGARGLWFGGYTCSTNLPTTSNAVQRTWPGVNCISEGLLGRMKADGSITYLSYFGGNGVGTRISALAVGPNGNVYVAGVTSSNEFPTTPGAFSRSCNETGSCTPSTNDGFVAELTADGSQIVFSTYIGGSDNDSVSAIAVDASGRIHVAGSTSSDDFPVTAGALQATYGGSVVNSFRETDAFYARLSADGASLQYGTYLGGSSTDFGTGVAIDSAGDVYVVGATSSDDFPTLNAANPNGPTNAESTFVVKFTNSEAVYSTYVGASGGSGANAVAVAGDRLYLAGGESSPDFPGGVDPVTTASAAYIAELDAASGALTRSVALNGTNATGAEGLALAVDQNHVAYLAGGYSGNDCISCGAESSRYPTTWDAYKHILSDMDTDAVLSIVDFGQQTPDVVYSTMLGGPDVDRALAVMPDGAGGAFVAGTTKYLLALNSQAAPKDAGADNQSFVAHVGSQQINMPAPPPDIVLYTTDLTGPAPSAIAGNWKIDEDSAAAGGNYVHQFDASVPKITTPAAYPQNYFELSFIADANVPYHLWMRMKAQNDSYQNDSVWVQFSDSIDAGGNPVWRIHTADGTPVSLEDCSGCGEQGWGWNDNGYGVPGTPVIFATAGWHTIRIQQREDGVGIDQVVLSSAQWANAAPGTNKNDSTILPETNEQPGDQPPVVSITSPANGATFSAGSNIDVTMAASDSDGSVSQVQLYVNNSVVGFPMTSPPYKMTLSNVAAGTYTLTAVATDNQFISTTSASVTITVSAGTSANLPQPWTDIDVGTTGAAGSASYANGVFTVQGAGADVWGTSDAFNYAYMPLPSDGKIIARVASVSNQAAWVKAGVMIRSSLSPSSAQAFMLVSSGKGVAFQRRTADGNSSVSTSGSASTAPHWVKLVRVASTIQGWESDDGSNWTFVGSDTFTMPGTVLVGLAVSSHVEGTLATAAFDNVVTQALPSGWGDADIGSVPFAGTANYDGSTFTVTGSGADIWGTADAFHYVWHLMGAQGTIVARVATIPGNVSSWVKAGVMIRDSFDPGSLQAFVLVSASKGVAFQRRDAAGGTSVSTSGSASTAPHWVKLTRNEDAFTAYESADGTTWTEIGSDTIPMQQSIYIGLAVTSHSTSSSATCTFDNVTITSGS